MNMNQKKLLLTTAFMLTAYLASEQASAADKSRKMEGPLDAFLGKARM